MASLVQDALDYAAEQTQQALAALGSSTTKETTEGLLRLLRGVV